MQPSMPKVNIAIVAPCPIGLDIDNGWIDRIWTVDQIFEDKDRLYLNFAPHHQDGHPIVQQRGSQTFETWLNPTSPAHKQFVDSIVERVSAIYVHTVHYAEYVLDWLPTGKVVVDIHGTVPEEERMLGRPDRAAIYEPVEAAVLKNAKSCVVVSNAMRKHYIEKYPSCPHNFVLLPIVRSSQAPLRRQQARRPDIPVSVLYSGGAQVWQNVDAMLQLSSRTASFTQFSFLSREWQAIKRASSQWEAPRRNRYCVADKLELEAEYNKSDFGLLLRDENTVNRVSSPTKLFDYIFHGIIPIVRSPLIGDFNDYGYCYVTETEFAGCFFPDGATRQWMADKNWDVLEAMRSAFNQGQRHVRDAIAA